MAGGRIWTALIVCTLFAASCNARKYIPAVDGLSASPSALHETDRSYFLECNNATTTISGTADASALVACKTFTGAYSVIHTTSTRLQLHCGRHHVLLSLQRPIANALINAGVIAGATDSDSVIELNGIEKIEGDFVARDNPKATTFGSNTLREATGKVEFSNIAALANISLPKWETAGMLVLDRVPAPTYTDFQQKGQQISEVYVTNTTFPFFSGLTLVGAQIDVLEIVDNAYLVGLVLWCKQKVPQC